VVTIRGERTTYGQAVGILMLDTRCPRLPGDVGNARTWPLPVRYLVVEGAATSRIMGRDPDPTLLQQFTDGARALEAAGVRAITTSCGFLAVYQRELAACVSVPVLTSALLQVPMAARLLRPDQRVGILTERPNLTEQHFGGCGWSTAEIAVAVQAMPPHAVFPRVYIDQDAAADHATLEHEVVDLAGQLVAEHPDVGAIVLECTNFVPHSDAVRRATGLPVFDLYTLVIQTALASLGDTVPYRVGWPSTGHWRLGVAS
jgi:hypothetical protein